MAPKHLRVYFGPEEETVEPRETNRVTVPLSEVFPLLSDALRSQRMWLREFEDDEIAISTDLYEMLLAYQHFRRPSA